MFRFYAKYFLSFFLYYSGLISFLRFLGRNNCKIVLYHSVSDTESNFIRGINIAVPPSVFIKHLAYMRRHYHIIPLKNAVESLSQASVLLRSVVLTFDDGFVDNYHVVYPYLKRNRIPATIFIVADCLDKNKPVWLQELYYLINSVGKENVLNKLRSLSNPLKAEGIVYRVSTKKSTAKQIEGYLTYEVKKDARDEVLAELYREFGIVKEEVFCDNQIFLNRAQVEEMVKDGIAFGNHGSSHTPFSKMAVDQQEREVRDSKRFIEGIIGKEFVPFAYPFGGSRDFTETSRRIVAEAGHSCILTTIPKVNDGGTSCYELGRVSIRNIPVHMLAFELEKATLKRLLGLGE